MNRKGWSLTCSTCAAASLGLSWFTWPRQDQSSSPSPVTHIKKSVIQSNLPSSSKNLGDLNNLNLTGDRQYLVNYLNNKFSQLDWIKLAFEGSDLLQYYQPSRDWSKDQEQESEEDGYLLLHQLELDSGWTLAKSWYLHKVCSEEDLQCQEALLATTSSSNSNYDRLVKLLSMLLYKSEFDVCEKLLQQDILHILYRLLTTHDQPSNKAISLLSLKILSNLAENSKPAAQQISESSLLPLLATMINHPVNEEEAILAHKVMVNMLYSLDMGSHKLPPDLYELYSPPLDQSPQLDVVFVHGLRGNAFRTWRQKERPGKKTTLFWPKEWLPSDLSSPIRIIAIDYSSRFFRLGKMLDTIESRSKRFQRQFTQAGVGQRPIVFICHSMGGLLVKHLLVDNEELRSKTIGVLFMATPHRGSPIASSLSYSLLRPSDDVRLLTEESEVNRDLHTNFSRVMHQIPLFVTILETKKTKVLGKWRLVVPGILQFSGLEAYIMWIRIITVFANRKTESPLPTELFLTFLEMLLGCLRKKNLKL